MNGNGKHVEPKRSDLRSQIANLIFADHSLLPMLYGEHDEHLNRVEKKFNLTASCRGNVLQLMGDDEDSVNASKEVMQSLYTQIESGDDIRTSDVDAAIRMAAHLQKTGLEQLPESAIKTLKKIVKPYSPKQAEYVETLKNHDLVFALGPAGTGKTYIAVAMAVHMFMTRQVERIILSRPAVEAGEKLGFLPGDLKEKIDPYLRPLYDALHDMIPGERVQKLMESGDIEVAPLAFMRGRTLSNAFVILDEAQNTTATQMKMFLTRMGEKSRMVVTGDLSQTDLPRDVKSGLADAVRKLEKVNGIAINRFADVDVVRHPLAARIIQAYDEWDRNKKKNSANAALPPAETE